MQKQEATTIPVAAGRTASVPGYAWVILLVVFLASVAAPLNQFKVPPVMPVLIQTFNLDLASAGMMMSIFSITGLLLALPAGFILQRFGPKAAGLVAVGFLVVGAAMGALSGSAGLLLASRLVEGGGMGLIAVVGPAAIAMWFPAERRGMPMGLWATWVPLGSVIMYVVAPALTTAYSWQSVWWLGAAFALLAFVLYGVFYRQPGVQGTGTAADQAEKPPDLRKAMANRSIWLLSLEFMCFNAASLAIGTFYPTYLNTVRSYALNSASFAASLAA